MSSSKHLNFLFQAVELSADCLKSLKGGPFGALIVKDGVVIATGVNEVLGNNDPTAHAEVQAIRAASRKLNNFDLAGCVIYSSCEPCPMCLAAIYWARIDAIYFANSREDAASIGFDDDFLYQELQKPLEQRKIPTYKFEIPDAKAVFNTWATSEQKQLY
jgi:guanine deaminase